MSLKKYLSKNLTPEKNLQLTNVLSSMDKLSADFKNAVTLTPGCELNNKILIGTHHKTGTVWLASVFKVISQFHSLNYNFAKRGTNPADFDIYMHDHSKFDFDAIDFEYRGMHIIRDPRDVIISGTFYHQKSQEVWLHEKQDRFNGMSYLEKINSIKDMDDKILFEMDHASNVTINEMIGWNYSNPNFIEVRYEDLIQDYDLELFHKIFKHLGFPGGSIPGLLNIAYKKSIFSGEVEKKGHIRSGKSRQWEKHFKPVHLEKFRENFGDVLIDLGYEEDDTWMDFKTD